MSLAITRNDPSLIGRWWWTVDRMTLAALLALVAAGALLVPAASPPVAERIGLPSFYFVERHLLLLVPALTVLFATSLLPPTGVRRLAALVLILALAGVAVTPLIGVEIKGARRWIHLAGISVQPSEFVKPALVVVTAWLFARARLEPGFPGFSAGIALIGLVAALLLAQPDLGQTVMVTAVFGAQLFLAGLPWLVVLVLAGLAVGGGLAAYASFPHVASRVDRFLAPETGDTYQIDRSLEALGAGGWTGTGPGHGTVKFALPDAHADFIFAVAGEEFGALAALGLVCLFAFIVLRGFARALADHSLFVTLAAAGLFLEFGLQALIHIASALHLMPTKGMTLPFVSYGGSSLLALGLAMGMALALTRRRYGPEERW